MKGKFARTIAVIATGSLLAVASGGMAVASPVGGHGSSSTEAAFAQVLKQRDDLTKIAYAGDVAGTKSQLKKLTPLLADLAAGKKYAIQVESQDLAVDAKARSAEVSRVLTTPGATPRQLPPLPDIGALIPDLPPPLSVVSDLLKTLLNALTGLLSSLLKALPIPLPLPALPLPAVPVPALPVPLPTP
ncbi:hypothetical protein AB5J62_40070 [Amycolatopsis sp. cg5]|uniref:hypothetical protein n=1 Tax=Amycolatopsis sp. cg5 TaxID=3238802 RepID=UPI003525B7DD